MLETIKKDIFINNDLRYYDLSNIFFDRPLKEKDIEELKQIFFSLNNISQLYFKNNIDVESIEKIKYLLEISPTMTDSLIEKFILDESSCDYKKLININFSNPNTWYISFREFNYEYKMISVDIYREINKYITFALEKINNEKYSAMEKILLIYDFCKEFKLVEENLQFVDILKLKRANNYGFVVVFQYLLKEIGIDSFIGEALVDNKKYNVVIANIKDSKYNIDGIYLFDPLSDCLSNEDGLDESLKNINYNFFAIQLNEYENTVFKDKLIDVLSCLIHDFEYDLEKLKFISPSTKFQLEKSFNMLFADIHQKMENSKSIDDIVKFEVIKSVYEKNSNIIIENYNYRKKKIINNVEIFYDRKM